MLKIKQATLVASAVRKNQYPTPLPSIVLLGRSNAGKSTLINTLIERKNLARTSSAPGKTRLLNFYGISGNVSDDEHVDTELRWYFVDLPGYGYAKVSKVERDKWLAMMSEYLSSNSVKLCWQLVDIRHKPSEQDIIMHRILMNSGYKVTVIANKADKISRNARTAALNIISKELDVRKNDIIVFSSITREGKDLLCENAARFLLTQADYNN